MYKQTVQTNWEDYAKILHFQSMNIWICLQISSVMVPL